jgi:hypothetical protein
MVKYEVVLDNNLDTFKEKVATLLRKGWELQGGVSVVQGREEYGSFSYTSVANSGQHSVNQSFIQALTKEV